MTKEKVLNDYNFRFRCSEYGIDDSDFELCNDVIILNTPKKGLYVLMNKKYDTIGIHETEFSNMHLTQREIAEGYMELHDMVDEKLGCILPYPFQNLSLRQIVELGSRIEIIPTNHGHSSYLMVNAQCVDEKTSKNYFGLLAYIQFLSEQIRLYYLNAYRMKLMGFNYPDIYSYIKAIMNSINNCINNSIENETRPFPRDVLTYLGENQSKIDSHDHHLYRIISLLLKDKGYRIKRGTKDYTKIEETEKNSEDLSLLAHNLLKLLDEPEDEIAKRWESKKFGRINLNEYFESDSKGPNPSTLVLK